VRQSDSAGVEDQETVEKLADSVLEQRLGRIVGSVWLDVSFFSPFQATFSLNWVNDVVNSLFGKWHQNSLYLFLASFHRLVASCRILHTF
jgi:hypothetical protein